MFVSVLGNNNDGKQFSSEMPSLSPFGKTSSTNTHKTNFSGKWKTFTHRASHFSLNVTSYIILDRVCVLHTEKEPWHENYYNASQYVS